MAEKMWLDDAELAQEKMKRVALRTGEELLKRFPYGGGGDVVGKGVDGTYTHSIDKVAEDLLFKYLEEEGFRGSVLSEERGYIQGMEPELMVVDPLDGTSNAIRGVPFYSISLALGEERRENWLEATQVGVVLELPSERTYWAIKGRGAYLDGRRIEVRPYREEDAIFSVFVGRGHIEEALRFLKAASKIRYLGSAALEMCLVAAGALDLFVQLGTGIRTFDIAASSLILKEAGGVLFAIEGEMLYKPKMRATPTERRCIVAVGDPVLLKTLYPPLDDVLKE
ncbi:MAG: D-fructose 1,6-bisphosphatase [Thermoplasmata archaeon]|nr:MAG: D-fructose 1,6-bisphosphatase [Thermoplasmata archaeon]RLF73516.1 MAG: D-fructose 1,6-bisphosphatase [Thermoplasmata archaeon]HDD59646.1 D-fructose 1,6-bisphosphatase [Euryarchaeota archaeon]